MLSPNRHCADNGGVCIPSTARFDGRASSNLVPVVLPEATRIQHKVGPGLARAGRCALEAASTKKAAEVAFREGHGVRFTLLFFRPSRKTPSRKAGVH